MQVKVGLSIRAGKVFDDKIYNRVLQKLSKTIIVTDFVQECKRITTIDHPNIVKVMGTCILPNQIFPSLVMELLDNNLHQYLETHHNIPLVIKQAMLEDVAKGLLFLHTQSPDPIVHCDLTAYNVLLTSSLVAKVSDIGNASFAALARKHGGGVAYPPKVKVYMPPEFEGWSVTCAPSVDMFSYGHLILFCTIQVGICNL
jgi:serine/threonine protein kinase